MAEAARALMEKLRETRERIRAASLAAGMDLHDQPTVEMEVVRLESDVAEHGEWSAAAAPAPQVDPEEPADPEPNPAEQPTVESEAIVLPPEPEAWQPVAATPMAAAFSHHPAFAVEVEDESAALPPLAAALAAAAASEREATDRRAPESASQDQPTVETPAIRTPTPAADRPAQPLTVPPAVEREPRRRLARGGLIIGLLLAVLRLLFGRR